MANMLVCVHVYAWVYGYSLLYELCTTNLLVKRTKRKKKNIQRNLTHELAPHHRRMCTPPKNFKSFRGSPYSYLIVVIQWNMTSSAVQQCCLHVVISNNSNFDSKCCSTHTYTHTTRPSIFNEKKGKNTNKPFYHATMLIRFDYLFIGYAHLNTYNYFLPIGEHVKRTARICLRRIFILMSCAA